MTDNRTTELLPCPFCGGEAVMGVNKESTVREYFIGCVNCHIRLYKIGYKRFYTEAEAIAAWNARAAGGTLTAEQVREAWCGNLKRDCLYDPPTPDWQAIAEAIADELNARAERTCRNVCEEWAKTSFAHAETSFCCSECGAHYVDCEAYYAGLSDADGEQIRTNFCPNCGAKVVGE